MICYIINLFSFIFAVFFSLCSSWSLCVSGSCSDLRELILTFPDFSVWACEAGADAAAPAAVCGPRCASSAGDGCAKPACTQVNERNSFLTHLCSVFVQLLSNWALSVSLFITLLSFWKASRYKYSNTLYHWWFITHLQCVCCEACFHSAAGSVVCSASPQTIIKHTYVSIHQLNCWVMKSFYFSSSHLKF